MKNKHVMSTLHSTLWKPSHEIWWPVRYVHTRRAAAGCRNTADSYNRYQ
jgi:hypothetical protein